MAIIISKTQINWGDAFDGFLPSKTVFRSDGLYTCASLSRTPRMQFCSCVLHTTAIGIIGATVMPHSLFLGSALATQDRVRASPAMDSTESSPDTTPVSVRNARTMARAVLQSCKRAFEVKRVEGTPDEPKSHNDRTNRPLSFVRAHLSHGIIDMVVSLLGLAVVINALYVQNCKLRYLPST